MSKIAAVPSLNKKGDTVLQPVKVQRYRRGQAPVGAAAHRSDDEDDGDAASDDAGHNASDTDDQLVAHKKSLASLAVSRTLGFASATSPPAKPTKTAYVAMDVPTAVSATTQAAASSDPRLRRLAALAASGPGRRRARTTSSGSDSESGSSEQDGDVGPRARGGATLAAQAERRLVLQQRLMEAEAAARADEQMKGGKALGLGGPNDEQDESEEEEDEESSESSSSEEEEEQVPAVKIKPKFVPKFQRKTVPDPATPAQLESTTHPSAATSAARRAESRALVQSEIQRAQADLAEHALAISAVDDTDDVDPAAEYAAWRERELARLRRSLAQRRAYEAEQAELERRRNMTPEERAAEAERVAREREEQQQNKPKVKFMQKYYHKGAFYMGDNVKDERGVLQRAATEARPDRFNYEVLPEVMQKKNFGLAGQTKWTHLAKEDTSNRKDAGWFKDKGVVQRMEKKRGGMGDIDASMARKRNRHD